MQKRLIQIVLSVSSTFGQNQRRKKGNSGNKENNKPWFNGECKVKRDEFQKKKCASSKTLENKTLLNIRAK